MCTYKEYRFDKETPELQVDALSSRGGGLVATYSLVAQNPWRAKKNDGCECLRVEEKRLFQCLLYIIWSLPTFTIMPRKASKSFRRPANQPSLLAFWGNLKKAPSPSTNNDNDATVAKKDRDLSNDSVHGDENITAAAAGTGAAESSLLVPKSTATTASPPTGTTTPICSSTKTASVTPEPIDPEAQQMPQEEDKCDEVKNEESAPNSITHHTPTVVNATTTTIGEPHQPHDSGLCDYELLRLRNIARNNARLQALGLLSNNTIHAASASSSTTSNSRAKGKRSSYKRPMTAHDEPTRGKRPTRRSTRLSTRSNDANNGFRPTTRNDDDKSSNANTTTMIHEQGSSRQPHVERVYEISPIVQYEMEQCEKKQASSSSSSSPAGCVINDGRLVPTGCRLTSPPGLSAIYSLNFYNDTDWIVGAGKAGIVAIWNSAASSNKHGKNISSSSSSSSIHPQGEEEYIDPVFSWKAHSGRWIAEAQFLTEPAQHTDLSPLRLVTAGNDGTVCLWDLGQVSVQTRVPKLLHQSDKSWHASGIFAMDVEVQSMSSLTKIATGSKDKTVAITSVSSESSRPQPNWRSTIHTGKVGAVKFRDNHVFATASDDGNVAILDDRMPDGDGPPVALVENLHAGRPHSVVWGPSSNAASDILLTAGLDSVIQAWDIRYLKQGARTPVCEYFGHVPTTTTRIKRIHHPAIYNHAGDRFILTGGQGSGALSLFKFAPLQMRNKATLVRSAVYSRGGLPEDCCHADVGSIALQRDRIAVTVDGEVLLLSPKELVVEDNGNNSSVAL